jgi:nucleoporin NDC1
MPEFANLSWITYFSGDRARVNERPLFLAFYLSYCALKQSIDHFKDDLDHLDMGSTSQEGSDGSAKPPTSLRKTLMRLPEMFATAVQQALLSLAVAPVLYLFFLRSISWRWALTFLRPFYNLPKTSIPPPSWPMDLFLLVRCVYAGTLLFFIWSAGNIAFSIFMVKEPLKNGQPLTSESKDPNGSLLNGLKSKKLSIQVCVRMEIRGERSLTSSSALQCGSWP